ncbi:MAG: hypothetical protein ACE5R4_06955 [Armatimonadota bacterium]
MVQTCAIGIPAALLAGLTGAALLATAAGGEAQERIRVSPENPRYWSYGGETVLLLGGSDEDNLFNDPALMLDNFRKLEACGGNYIRGTLSCRDEGNVWPYRMVGGKYDLRQFNPEFWDRLEACCREAQRRDIIVQIEVWATFDFYRDIWLRNPFNPANNSNYTTANTRLEETWDHHPAGKPQPFFYSPPALNDDKLLRSFQDAFVRKVLDVTVPYPNVLYCLDNETKTPPQWAWYWGDFIQREAKRRNVAIQLTEMWDAWDLTHEHHGHTYKRPEYFSFTDVSQNNWQVGQLHYDRLLWFRENLVEQPGGIRPMNNVKVYGMRRPRQGEAMDFNLDRWWQNIWAGCASTRFHRPPTGIGLDSVAQQAIRAARSFTNAFDIFSCEPRPDLLSDREDNEAYCLADPPETYALYLPQGGEVTLEVGETDQRRVLRWFDPTTASFREAQELGPEATTLLRSPDTKQTWLVLVREVVPR